MSIRRTRNDLNLVALLDIVFYVTDFALIFFFWWWAADFFVQLLNAWVQRIQACLLHGKGFIDHGASR